MKRVSDVAWMAGQLVPETWRTMSLKRLVRFTSGDAITAESIESEGPFAVYGANGLRGFTSEANAEGDRVLVGRVGALCGNVHLVAGRYWVSEHALIANPQTEVSLGWLRYLLLVMNLGQYSQATAQPVIAGGNIENLRIEVPPTDEQAAIADYLDRETARMDAMIDEQQRLVELLLERREAVVVSAFADLRADEVRLKWLASARSGTQCARIEDDGTVPVFGAGKRLGWTEEANAGAGDLVVGRVGSVGSLRLLNGDAWATDNTLVLTFDNRLHPRFAELALSVIDIDLLVSGTAMPLITATKLLESPVPLPSLDVQRSVAAHVDESVARIDALITEAEGIIEATLERRAALISAVATGQVDVREDVA